MKITIPIKVVSLNEYIDACRSNRYAGAKMKADMQEQISWYVKKLPKQNKPVKITFTWYEKDQKRDLDNVCFAKKFILDSMVECGVLENDNRKWVTGFEDKFPNDRGEYKVEVEIEEVN
jgi:Holliday junction resolvase RusA-like endonuclease